MAMCSRAHFCSYSNNRGGSSSYITMTSAFICICNYNARNCRALAKHNQRCEVARAHIGINFNVLLSMSMHCGGSGGGSSGGDDKCDNDGTNNVVYKFHDYNASNKYEDVVNDTLSASLDDSSLCVEDGHSATISFCSMDVVDEFNNNQNSKDDIDNDDAKSDGSMSCEYHTSPSTSTSDSEGHHPRIIPKYYPPMFSNKHRRQCFLLLINCRFN